MHFVRCSGCNTTYHAGKDGLQDAWVNDAVSLELKGVAETDMHPVLRLWSRLRG